MSEEAAKVVKILVSSSEVIATILVFLLYAEDTLSMTHVQVSAHIFLNTLSRTSSLSAHAINVSFNKGALYNWDVIIVQVIYV